MAVSGFYKDGTIAVTNASTTVTGTGTTWSSSIQAGDEISIVNVYYEIASVTSDTVLVLVDNYIGTTASGLSYRIKRTFAGAYAAEASRQIQDTLTNGTIGAYAGANPGADEIVYGTGAGTASSTPITAFARTLLDDADAATATTTIGALAASNNLSDVADAATARTNLGAGAVDNDLINGGFDIWQRGTSFTGIANAYSADRWALTGSGTFDVSQQTFTLGQTAVPGSPKKHIRLLRATAGNHWFLQRIENPSCYSDQTVTLSFWAKASTAVSIDAYLWCATAGGSTDFSAVTSASVSVTTSWQKFTVTYSIVSFTGKTINDSSGANLALNFTLHNIATAASIDFAQVKLERGSSASDFVPRSEGEELALCRRFLRKIPALQGAMNAANTGATFAMIEDISSMRTGAPTFTNIDTASKIHNPGVAFYNITSVNFASANYITLIPATFPGAGTDLTLLTGTFLAEDEL